MGMLGMFKRKAEKMIMETALKELKRRVESWSLSTGARSPNDPVRDEAERSSRRPVPVSTAARGLSAAAGHGRLATGSAECCVCPVCRVIAAMRDPDPDLAQRLSRGAGDLATGIASLLRSMAPTAGTPTGPRRGRDEDRDEDRDDGDGALWWRTKRARAESLARSGTRAATDAAEEPGTSRTTPGGSPTAGEQRPSAYAAPRPSPRSRSRWRRRRSRTPPSPSRSRTIRSTGRQRPRGPRRPAARR